MRFMARSLTTILMRVLERIHDRTVLIVWPLLPYFVAVCYVAATFLLAGSMVMFASGRSEAGWWMYGLGVVCLAGTWIFDKMRRG